MPDTDVRVPEADAAGTILLLVDAHTDSLWTRNEVCHQSGYGCFDAVQAENEAWNRLESAITALVRERDSATQALARVKTFRDTVALMDNATSGKQVDAGWVVVNIDAATAPPEGRGDEDGLDVRTRHR